MYLLVWAESGFFALAAFLVFLLSVTYQGWWIWRLSDLLLAPIGLAIMVTVVGQMVHMLVDMFNSGPYTLTFCYTAAILVGMARLSQEGAENVLSAAHRWLPRTAPGIGQLRYS
jgi:O-antigen ligase